MESRQIGLQREIARMKRNDEAKPFHKRKWAGGADDYLIIDEFGRTVWASDWCKRAYAETLPRGRMR